MSSFDKHLYSYLTPAVARIAYEQTVAFYREKWGFDAPIPATVEPHGNSRFAFVMDKAGIDIALLVQAGIATVEHVHYSGAGLTGYGGTDTYYTINMTKLYALSQENMPAPAMPAAAAVPPASRPKLKPAPGSKMKL